MLLTEKN